MIDAEKSADARSAGVITSDGRRASVSDLTSQASEMVSAHRWGEGARLNRAIVEVQPGNFRGWAQLGHCEAELGNVESAIASYRKALSIEKHAWLHNDLGVVLIDAGDGAAAAEEFQEAIRLNPTDAMTLANLGSALRLMKKPVEAREAFEKAIAIDPANAIAHGNLGNLLRDMGETDAAIRSLQASIKLEPGSAGYAFLAGALLEAGRASDALRALDQALKVDPVNRTAFAYKSAALQEAGDMPGAKFLLDLDNLIDVKQFENIAGYPSLESFNRELETEVLNHRTLSFERTGNATRFGSHTSDLLLGADEAVAAFEGLINERVSEYFANRKIQPDHPFMAHRMKSWSSVAWGVVMRSGGHQIPHIHPSAWLSGVYYVKVPPSVREDSSTREGWIEFGSPPDSLSCKRQQIRKFFFPQEGKMILFPSYFYHRTVPLASGEERISIAFDVSPGPPRRQGT